MILFLFATSNNFIYFNLLMMLFQPKLDWSVLKSLGRSAFYGCWALLQKQETKRTGGGSLVASLMPKSVPSGGREDQLLKQETRNKKDRRGLACCLSDA